MGNSNDSSLISSFKEKSQAAKKLGGVEKIERVVSELSASHQKNEVILKECEKMLSDEERSDSKFRAKFREKWTMTPSDELNGDLKAGLELYKMLMDAATNVDASGREKYEKNKDRIAILCLSEDEIAEFLKERHSNGTNRNAMLSEINSAYDDYMELLKNLKDGTEAYENLSRRISTLRNQITDFCTSRNAESEELQKCLQRSVVSTGTQTSSLQSPNEEDQSQKNKKLTCPNCAEQMNSSSLRETNDDKLLKKSNTESGKTNLNMFVSETRLLSKHFKELFTNANFWDTIVKVGDKEFKIHKAILSARLSVLSDKIQHDPSGKQIIEVPDCDPDIFKKKKKRKEKKVDSMILHL